MIRYATEHHKNIYLKNGYKVYAEAIAIEDVQDLQKTIDEDSKDLKQFKSDPSERNIYCHHVVSDKFNPNTLLRWWEHIERPTVWLAEAS